MKNNIMKKLKLKKIFISNNKKIIDLFYVENDFYYSIIYHPKEPLWEPIYYFSSPEPLCRSSVKIEESGFILYQRTSLKAHRDIYKIFQNRNNDCIQDNDISNISELKKSKIGDISKLL